MSAAICPHCGQTHRQTARFCTTTGKLMPGQPFSQPVVVPVAGMTGKLQPNAYLRNRYLIVRKIGHGGMAAVYQAVDTQQPGTQWAIKEMSDAAITDAQERAYAIQAFQQEAALLRTLNHPNLPKVIDGFAEGGKHYLVMEYVPGQTLFYLLAGRANPFSEMEVLSWTGQLLDVLDYLHSQDPKIIFRDLKPSNIMLTPQGQVKLIDFGIVRFFKPGKKKDTVALGTPGYVAPEALAGQTDERSDIYSLCVTLHQLLTLHDPCVSMFNLPPLHQINQQVSEKFSGILARGLENQRERRWSSAGAMRSELVRLGFLELSNSMTPNLVTPELGGMAVAGSVFSPSGTVVVGDFTSKGTQTGEEKIPSRAPSRPTTRLLMAATELTGKQISVLALMIVVVLTGGTLVLAPLLEQMPIDWNVVPIFALFGPMGFAAYPRRGTAFMSHVLLSGTLVAMVWFRLGSQGFSWMALILAAVLSGVFMEFWVALLPRVKGKKDGETWMREAGWMAAMALIGTILFLGLASNWIIGLNPGQWLVSCLLGAAGWFIGDLVRQFLLHRQTRDWRAMG